MRLIYIPILLILLSFNGAASLNLDTNHYQECKNFQRINSEWNTVIVSDDNFTKSTEIFNYKVVDSETIEVNAPYCNDLSFQPLDHFYNSFTSVHFFVNNQFPQQNITGLQDNTEAFLELTLDS